MSRLLDSRGDQPDNTMVPMLIKETVTPGPIIVVFQIQFCNCFLSSRLHPGFYFTSGAIEFIELFGKGLCL